MQTVFVGVGTFHAFVSGSGVAYIVLFDCSWSAVIWYFWQPTLWYFSWLENLCAVSISRTPWTTYSRSCAETFFENDDYFAIWVCLDTIVHCLCHFWVMPHYVLMFNVFCKHTFFVTNILLFLYIFILPNYLKLHLHWLVSCSITNVVLTVFVLTYLFLRSARVFRFGAVFAMSVAVNVLLVVNVFHFLLPWLTYVCPATYLFFRIPICSYHISIPGIHFFVSFNLN